MKTFTWAYFVLSVCFCSVELLPLDNGINNEEIRFAGTAEGKTFFAVYNSTHFLTWKQAGKACDDMSMQLAELTTRNQIMAVANAAKGGLINDAEYWVAAGDAWEPRQFSWNSTEIYVTASDTIINVVAPSEPLSCLGFHPHGRSFPDYHLRACTTRNNYRLCQVNSTRKVARKPDKKYNLKLLP